MSKKETGVFYDREQKIFRGITEEQIKTLQDVYPDACVQGELKKMGLWLESSRGAGRKGNIGFVMNWLSRLCGDNRKSDTILHSVGEDSALRPLIDDYLNELWVGKGYIFNLNTKNGK